MDSRLARLPLAVLLALVAFMALAGVAQAAAGTVTILEFTNQKVVKYNGSADANVVAFGGSEAGHTATITETGIADPGPGDDAHNICSLSGDTLTCTDPELLDADADLAGGTDESTTTGTLFWGIDG